ncbi:molybdopterin-dependent oxidoreductase [Mobilicoccus caccae]|uniref:Biotin transporter BioY n=1 Tax=Mobilicoccus caccae TaxID=1859295 RepID=A0ABQ6IX70_9MICO|nr:molybdopterin-dependent oxidoreductase [Mobilicoccus caccae]GMA41332.1 biotin transporter BioY [Mobilicoccus caccae]
MTDVAGPASGVPHAAHWGTYTARTDREGRDVADVTPWSGDAAPSPLLGNIPGSVTHRSRVARPAVRRGWWEDGPGPSSRRGRDSFVQPPWDEVLDVLAGEYARVVREFGNSAIYGGSYGWASAGRFHHAQSQVHRFLNRLGGYTGSVNSYSTGASEVILPHVIAPESVLTQLATTWDVLARECEVFVCFGGVPLKNTGTDSGGSGPHPTPAGLAALQDAGARIVAITPIADDLGGAREVGDDWFAGTGRLDRAADAGAAWIPIRPGTDVALMLALVHVLDAEGLADEAFLQRYCVGAEAFRAYVRGESDGVAKTPEWAARLCEVPASRIVALARLMAAHRTTVTVTWSLQRTEHGEQPLWAALALAAFLGQIGLPGGGYANGYGSMNKPGLHPTAFRLPSLPQGANPVTDFIPVARVTDMLERPGGTFTYDGGTYTYPDIRLMVWAGGNPFHHHQDLGRLRRALGGLDTLVVHDPYWTPLARHADVVLPSTTSLERDDLAGTRASGRLGVMAAAVPRHEQARDDYDILAALAERLGFGEAFTEGRDARQWIEHLYDTWREDLTRRRIVPPGAEAPTLPDLAQVWEAGGVELPTMGPIVAFADFRRDPSAHPLPTPSGRIELFSDVIKGYDLPDCPPHPTWLEPTEWLGGEGARRWPLHLVANQPRTRLHSQLDHGATSQASKVAGREPIRLHPVDAAARGIGCGDVVRVFTDRGACLAGAVLSDALRPGVVQLSTGAWFDPYDPARHGPEAGAAGLAEGTCVHGNPNVLTADRGTSGLAQACTGQHVLVEIERWDGPVPPVLAFDPPV